MLETIIVAAALYVCPGEVYTDTPRAGCQPLQESNREGFSTIPESPEFTSKSSAPAGESIKSMRDGQSRIPAASAEECAMYEEWVKLSTKSSSLGARTSRRPNSNDGRTSNRSLETVLRPIAGSLLPFCSEAPGRLMVCSRDYPVLDIDENVLGPSSPPASVESLLPPAPLYRYRQRSR